jgi:hypothetical protein
MSRGTKIAMKRGGSQHLEFENGRAATGKKDRPGSLAYYIVCGRHKFFDRRRRATGGNMKRELLKGFTMLMLVVVLALATAVVSANAQTASKANKVAADIPFEFSIGYKTLPAGEYIAQTVATAGDSLMIQSGDGKISAVRLSEATAPRKNKTHARLVFHRYGQQYFLAEVWNGADNTGRQLSKSQEERAMESELANISSQSESGRNTFEVVEIMAVLR